jgi:hypothetical protein
MRGDSDGVVETAEDGVAQIAISLLGCQYVISHLYLI